MNKQTINILLVEDSPVACEFMQNVLSDSSESIAFTIETAGDLALATDILGRKSFDIILLDLGLPDSDGIDTVKRVHVLNPNIPIIILTGSDNEELGVEAIKEGAEDYLIKIDVSKHVATRAIRYAIERKKMKRRLLKAHDELDQRVQERTAELARANEQLTLSNIELQDFAHVVAHDLKDRKSVV